MSLVVKFAYNRILFRYIYSADRVKVRHCGICFIVLIDRCRFFAADHANDDTVTYVDEQ